MFVGILLSIRSIYYLNVLNPGSTHFFLAAFPWGNPHLKLFFASSTILFICAGNITFVGTSVVFLALSPALTLTCLYACFSNIIFKDGTCIFQLLRSIHVVWNLRPTDDVFLTSTCLRKPHLEQNK